MPPPSPTTNPTSSVNPITPPILHQTAHRMPANKAQNPRPTTTTTTTTTTCTKPSRFCASSFSPSGSSCSRRRMSSSRTSSPPPPPLRDDHGFAFPPPPPSHPQWRLTCSPRPPPRWPPAPAMTATYPSYSFTTSPGWISCRPRPPPFLRTSPMPQTCPRMRPQQSDPSCRPRSCSRRRRKRWRNWCGTSPIYRCWIFPICRLRFGMPCWRTTVLAVVWRTRWIMAVVWAGIAQCPAPLAWQGTLRRITGPFFCCSSPCSPSSAMPWSYWVSFVSVPSRRPPTTLSSVWRVLTYLWPPVLCLLPFTLRLVMRNTNEQTI